VANHYAGIDNLTVQQARPSDLEFLAARVIVAKQNLNGLVWIAAVASLMRQI
jgi:hypothetical protein